MRPAFFGSKGLVLVLGFLLLAPTAAAEFGRESADGWAIGADGREQLPPVAGMALPDGPLNKVGPQTVYPYYPVLVAELNRLATDHPDLVKLTSIGKSTLGLDLWMLEIADFANPDMKPLEEREVVWIDGGHHSNEYSGVYFVTEWAQFLLDEYETNETAKWIVENRHTYIVPMVNPDGSHAMGRLNAKGVNINRNYPVGWAGLDEDPVLNNPGPSAASEPETQALMAAWDAVRPDYLASIHCCGNLWLFPYGIEGVIAPDNETFTRICIEAFPDVLEDCGPIWSTIYPASGSSVDTAYEQVGAAAFGFEMSGRANLAGPWGEPFTGNDVREQERESWAGVLHAFLHAERYGAWPRVVAVEGDEGALRVTLRNDGYGNLTHGNLTLGEAKAALPWMAPNATAVVELAGAFAPGEATLALDYVARAMASPARAERIGLELVANGAGLVGVLGDGAVQALATEGGARDVPASGAGLGALALAAVGVALRRRR